MVGPLDEPLIYRKDISPGEYAYMSADVKLREITYQRRLGGTGNGVVASEREYTPWIELDRDGRPDERVRCPAFGTDLRPRLHDLAGYSFYNPPGRTWNVFYPKVSGTSPRYNIDHAGGDPHILQVRRLRLELAMKSAKEEASIRKMYRQSGSRIYYSWCAADEEARGTDAVPEAVSWRSFLKWHLLWAATSQYGVWSRHYVPPKRARTCLNGIYLVLTE